MNGRNRLPGRDGPDGSKGDMGVAGSPGPRGVKGLSGVAIDQRSACGRRTAGN